MRKYLLGLFFIGLICPPPLYSSTAFFCETLTIGTVTAVGISTAAKNAELKSALISAETADLRFWYDGSVPATNTGHLLLKNNHHQMKG